MNVDQNGTTASSPTSSRSSSSECVVAYYYLNCEDGNVLSQENGAGVSRSYIRKTVNSDGTVIGVRLSTKGDLSFLINDRDMGVAFRGLVGMDFYPAFELSDPGCEFEFV